MALNLSRGSILPTYPSSVWYSNGYVMDQYKENNLDGVCDDSSSSWGFNLDLRNTHWGTELGGYCDHSADDIVDRLPVDPFGMGIRSTFTAITGWLQGFEKEHESYGSGLHEAFGGGLLAGFNWAWNSAVMFQPEVCDLRFDGISIPYDSFDEYGINDGSFVLDGNVEEFLSFSGNLDFCDGAKELQVETKEIQGCSIMHPNGEGSAPHDAMFYALSFLGVKDLLSVEKVCRSFRDSVRSDPLLWRSIVIDWPLNEIVTDDVLIKLTDRAQGTLQALTLVHCVHITDFGLQRVFDRNPKLTKLSVPGCLKISVADILSNLWTLKSAGKPGIKQLRIGGLSGITERQFEELKFLLGADNCVQFRAPKPRFFHGGLSHLSCDDDCAIDVEACPRCQKLSLVYDCPAKNCQGKHHADQMCRACTLCIARCISCGCCLQDTDYEETFCLDLLCIVCLEKILKCRHGEKGAPKCAFFCQENRSRCFLAGDSAGANVAHHVAIRAAREKDRFRVVKPVGLILIQPFFGGEGRVESEIRLHGAPLVSITRTDWLWKAFLPDGSDRDHEAANVTGPNAVDISGLDYPSTLVFVGGFDPLLDWQKRYYQWLKKSGKEAKLIEYPNSIHAFYVFPELPESNQLLSQVKDFVASV